MNTTGCCSSCTAPNAESIFTVGNYVPASVGYDQTYSFPNATPRGTASVGAYPSATRPTGITPVGMAGECMGEPVARPCNYETATLGGYNRGSGNPDPMYAVGSYASTGNPTQWRPMSAYASTGNPTQWRPMSGYSNTGNPTNWNPMGRQAPTGFPDRVNPLGRQARTGYPDRVNPIGSFAGGGNGSSMVQRIGDGSEKIGGVQPVGFLWPLVTAIVGLGAVAGATYVANSGVDNITTNPDIASTLSQPVVQTTSNIATTFGLGLLAYVIFRKDIQKLLK